MAINSKGTAKGGEIIPPLRKNNDRPQEREQDTHPACSCYASFVEKTRGWDTVFATVFRHTKAHTLSYSTTNRSQAVEESSFRRFLLANLADMT